MCPDLLPLLTFIFDFTPCLVVKHVSQVVVCDLLLQDKLDLTGLVFAFIFSRVLVNRKWRLSVFLNKTRFVQAYGQRRAMLLCPGPAGLA